MVKEKVSKRWSVPFGKIEEGESAQQACIREVREETGIIVSVEKAPHTKKAVIGDYDVEIYYFRCEMCAGEIAYADPDREIEKVAWYNHDELLKIEHDYPDDVKLLLSFIKVPNPIAEVYRNVL